MLDMGFKPQVERILARLPRDRQTMLFSATLDGEVGELARAYTRQPVALRGEPAGRAESGERRAQVRRGDPRRQARRAGRAARRRARPRARLRAHQARRRPARREARAGATSRRPRCTATCRRCPRTGPRPLPGRQGATLVATDVAARGLDLDDITHVINFDPPARRHELRPPGRSHRPGRAERQRHHVRPARAAGRHEPRRGTARSYGAVRAGRPHGRTPRKVYTSRRSRRTRW